MSQIDIKTLREKAGLTQQELADKSGIPRDRIAKWEQRGSIPKVVDYQVILSILDGTNLPDEGVKSDFVTQRRAKKLAANVFMAPLIPVKAQAGYTKAVDQTIFMDTLEKYALPPGVDPHAAVWAYWEVQGDSMEPSFYNGDYILATQVPRMDWDQLRNFYVYVLVTHEKVLIKRVMTKNQLEWVLISENESHYPQQLIQVDDIKEVWVFRRHINSRVPPPKMYEIKV